MRDGINKIGQQYTNTGRKRWSAIPVKVEHFPKVCRSKRDNAKSSRINYLE